MSYNVNALTYFTLTGNCDGLRLCAEHHVPFLLDRFNNTPYDYAKNTNDPEVETELFNVILNYPPALRD